MSEAFFHTCKPALDVDYLEDGDLALVQTFLIIAHYLQGSRAPNRCWHIIGTAIRLAQGVGLHSDIGDEHRSFAETQIRRRVWHGCVMLDLAVSIMLGRPVMISHKPSTPLPDPIDDRHLAIDYPTCEQPPGTFSHVEWFIATLKLYGLLRKTLHMLYDNDGKQCNGNPADQTRSGTLTQIQYITQLDSELQDFRLEVPMPLHWDVPASEVQPQFLREQHLLKARYVYLKLLIYRPVLSKSLHENLSTGTERASSRAGICANFAMDCVFFCVQSAIELINLIHETCNTDLASVWYYNIFYLFTAGSITLLAELYPPIVSIVTRETLEISWIKCQGALNYLKSYSIVAERCAESMAMIRSKCLEAISEKLDQPQESNEKSGLAAESAGQMPFSEDILRDFDFNAQTFFDPVWFNLGF